jgi:hypothetical protein
MAMFQFLDRFRDITDGKVISKQDYGAIAGQDERIVGSGKNAIIAPATAAVDERYSITVRGTVRPGGKVYTHEIYVWGYVWGNISIGDPWPQGKL